MNASSVAAILAAVLSTACSTTIQFGDHGHVKLGPPQRNAPVGVNINEAIPAPDGVWVDQDPIYAHGTPGGTTHLRWTLPSHSAYTFPPNGIVIHAWTGGPAPVELSCTPGQKVVNCNYKTPPAKTRYKYDVNVVGPGGVKRNLDPTIMN